MDELEPRIPQTRWLRPQELRWLALLSPLFCLAAACMIPGPERWFWVAMGVFLAAVLLPAVTRDRPLAHALAQGFRSFAGIALTLGGLAGCAGSLWLFSLGSFAILLALMLLPISATVSYLGVILLSHAWHASSGRRRA